MSARPRILDELAVELDRAARVRLARSRGGRLPARRLSIVAVIVGALVLAAAAAAAILISRGAPLPAPHAQDLQSNGVPLRSSARLAGLDAPDPEAGAPPWDIRLSRTRDGETCTAVGQVLAGQFGIVGLDHVFRALPLGGVDSCGVAAAGGPVLAGARVFVGRSSGEARTVVNGVAGDGARSVTAYGPGGPRVLRLGPQGSFITVYRGYVEEVRPRIVVVGRDGVSHTIAFAQSSSFEVADPDAGSPWQISGEADLEPAAYLDEDCAQASQALGRSDPSRFEAPLTPPVCGRLAEHPLFVSIRRFVPGSGEGTGFPWGNSPARTLVYGAAAPRVASLTLSGAGAPRSVPIDAHGGVFIAVLDGHVDPRSLTLSARLRDGSTVVYRHSANLLSAFNPRVSARSRDAAANRPLPEPPVPPYRNPLPASENTPPPFETPVRSSVRETLHAADPAGGPTWALRSWQGVPNPKAKFGSSPPTRFLCLQVGVVRGRQLVAPRPGSAGVLLAVAQGAGEEEAHCNSPSDLQRLGPLFAVQSYVEDPDGYAPRVLRTVLSGQLPPGASDPVLLGAGPPRPLAVDANRAFLAVLPGRYWDAQLHVSVRGGKRPTRRRARLAPAAARSSDAPQARAPDPDGGAPWGFSVTASGSSEFGRIVDGRLADIDEARGTLESGPVEWSSGGASPPGKRPQVSFEIEPVSIEADASAQSGTTLTRAQIERRTLPGRTIITGVASADVLSVTLATPRDVRTLRPAGPRHVLIAVYDGQFFRGVVTATIRLRDGHTVTQELQGPGDLGDALSTPSIATMRSSAERQLATVHANRKLRAGRGSGLIAQLEARVRVIDRRIAYERAHPGLLPAN